MNMANSQGLHLKCSLKDSYGKEKLSLATRLAAFRDKLLFLSALGFLELCHMAEPHHSKVHTPRTLSQHVAEVLTHCIHNSEPA